MNNGWRKLALVVVAAFLCGMASGCEKRKVMLMDKTGWETHCIGRFLVELPPDAKMKSAYKIEGDLIERTSIPKISLSKVIDDREAQLKSEPHETKGALFIRREDYPGGGASLLSWRRKSSEVSVWVDSYLTSREGRYVFTQSGLVSPGFEDSAMNFQKKLNEGMKELAAGEIPGGPGYCIDGEFIADDGSFRSEVFNIGVTLPQHPGMNITLLATTQGEVDKETLLDRAVGTEALLLAKGGKRLRKGKHAAGGGAIPGEEYLMVGEEDGQKKYGFTWEAPGKAESVTEPYMTVELQMLGQSVVDEEHPYKPPFASDDEALQLWDAILESLRLRPSAAVRR